VRRGPRPAFQLGAHRACASSSRLELNKREDRMASTGKRKTTMAKLNRERRLVERRLEKQAKKLARKQASAHHPSRPGETLTANDE
jgi:phosphatidate phosphatase PAH1